MTALPDWTKVKGDFVIRSAGTRKEGTTYIQVLYRLDGCQTSTPFRDAASAAKFRDLVN